jgi:hypothetical protein
MTDWACEEVSEKLRVEMECSTHIDEVDEGIANIAVVGEVWDDGQKMTR